MDYRSIITTLGLILFTSVFSFGQTPTEAQILEVEEARKEVMKMKGKPFPEFDLIGLDGQHYTSENTKGKIVHFNFWFTSCRPCVEEMPELNEMAANFSDEDILFLAPTFDDSLLVKKFLNQFEFNYEIVSNQRDFCLDLNVRNFPTHFIINREGIIEKVHTGYSITTVGALRKTINKLLRAD